MNKASLQGNYDSRVQYDNSKVFCNWKGGETDRLVASGVVTKDIRKVTGIWRREIARFHTQSPQPYFFSVCIKTSPDPQETKKVDIVIKRLKDKRSLPENFNEKEDVDLITQELIPRDQLLSPLMIYASNYVVNAKKYVRVLLTSGKITESGKFIDPIYQSELSEKERSAIEEQINKIFCVDVDKLRECLIQEQMEVEERYKCEIKSGSIYARYYLDSRVSYKNGSEARSWIESYLQVGEGVNIIIGDSSEVCEQELSGEAGEPLLIDYQEVKFLDSCVMRFLLNKDKKLLNSAKEFIVSALPGIEKVEEYCSVFSGSQNYEYNVKILTRIALLILAKETGYLGVLIDSDKNNLIKNQRFELFEKLTGVSLLTEGDRFEQEIESGMVYRRYYSDSRLFTEDCKPTHDAEEWLLKKFPKESGVLEIGEKQLFGEKALEYMRERPMIYSTQLEEIAQDRTIPEEDTVLTLDYATLDFDVFGSVVIVQDNNGMLARSAIEEIKNSLPGIEESEQFRHICLKSYSDPQVETDFDYILFLYLARKMGYFDRLIDEDRNCYRNTE